MTFCTCDNRMHEIATTFRTCDDPMHENGMTFRTCDDPMHENEWPSARAMGHSIFVTSMATAAEMHFGDGC